jgi:pyruvate/2-oxoglutarate dehydrogenase complex dihydrolipoamide acyltransferase (E2) component
MRQPRQRLRFALVAGLFAAIVQGQPPADAQAEIEKAVLQAMGEVEEAGRSRDTHAYDALTTADFIRITGHGRFYGKADWLKSSGAPGPERPRETPQETTVRIYGNAAVVTYRSTPTMFDGRRGPISYFARVFEKQGAQWKLALTQSTGVEAPPAPTEPAPAPLPAWSPSTALEKEALAAFEAIQKANRDSDVVAWERLSAPDHVVVTAEGRRITRAERVRQLKAPPAANAAPAAAETDVRLSVKGGSVAIVTWKAGEARSLKVLAKTANGWQQVLQQSSPIVVARP